MVMVLDTVGLPADDVALILAIDWLLDRQVLKSRLLCQNFVGNIELGCVP